MPDANTVHHPQRVLVTGVAGFIGSHVAEALVRRGVFVVGVDGFIDSYSRADKERNLQELRRHPRFRFAEVDLRTADLDPLLGGIDTVVNEAAFAGLPRSWTDVPSYVECNLLALSRLVDASTRAGVRRFLQASTSSVYGVHAVGDEAQPTAPVSPYGVSKLAAEHLLLAHVYEHGFPAVILRYFSIYGPRQRPDMAYRIFTERLLAGEPLTVFGDGRQSRSNTYVDDCVAGTLGALEAARIGEIYNIGGGQELDLLTAIETIAATLGTWPVVEHREARPGDQRRTLADVSKARDHFGYSPSTPPSVGLAAQVAWHQRTLAPPRSRADALRMAG